MKQHITIEQLGQLSVEGLRTYRSISQEKGWVDPHGETRWSIGQMIEFLDEQYKSISKAISIDDASFALVHQQGWSVGDLNEPHGPESYTYITSWVYKDGNYYPELCDALWEAVKEVLEK